MSPVRTDALDPDAVPVRDASTVVLLRDGSEGIEVCLMRHNLDSDFVGGAHVFPGGGVDAADRSVAASLSCVGLDDAEASRRLGLDNGGLAFWVAAIRESFEEAGVLMARRTDGGPVDASDPTVSERLAILRAEVDAATITMAEAAAREGLVLDAGRLHHFSRWITPVGAHRRYDTYFFVAAAPEDQEVRHDDRELIGTNWWTPHEALRRHDDGEIVLLEEQDRGRWDRAAIDEGLVLTEAALRRSAGRPDPFSVQAAIAACHARARRAVDTDWVQIAALYEALAARVPSPVVELNRAVALGMAFGVITNTLLVSVMGVPPARASASVGPRAVTFSTRPPSASSRPSPRSAPPTPRPP